MQKHSFLPMFKTVVLLNIFVETMIKKNHDLYSLMNRKLIKKKISCNNVKVTFDKFKVLNWFNRKAQCMIVTDGFYLQIIFCADFRKHIVFICHASSSNKACVSAWVCCVWTRVVKSCVCDTSWYSNFKNVPFLLTFECC